MTAASRSSGPHGSQYIRPLLQTWLSPAPRPHPSGQPPLTPLVHVAASPDTVVHSVMYSHMVAACINATCQAGQRSHNRVQRCSPMIVACIPSASEKMAPSHSLGTHGCVIGCHWDSMHNLMNQERPSLISSVQRMNSSWPSPSLKAPDGTKPRTQLMTASTNSKSL